MAATLVDKVSFCQGHFGAIPSFLQGHLGGMSELIRRSDAHKKRAYYRQGAFAIIVPRGGGTTPAPSPSPSPTTFVNPRSNVASYLR